jgi:glycosyltransferase involved in cell wall biosynthesis
MNPKVSAIVIVGNQLLTENLLSNCIKTLGFCDEILLVDFSQNHRLRQCLKTRGLTVYQFQAEGDSLNYAKIRDFASAKARGEWLFFVDPDERVTPILASEITNEIKKIKNDYQAYQLPRKNYYLGKEFKQAGAWPDYVTRLIKKDSLVGWQGVLHEQPKVNGSVGELKNPLVHLTHRSIEDMTQKTINWSLLEARLRQQNNHPPMTSWRFWRIIITSVWDNFVKKKAYKEGTEGTIEGWFQVFSLFMTYVRLWELQQDPDLLERYRQIDEEIVRQWQK